MCDCPSWIETEDKRNLFVTDSDVVSFHENQPGTEAIDWNDCCGHSFIQKVYGKQINSKNIEGFPCPPEIETALREGKMNRMLRSSVAHFHNWKNPPNSIFMFLAKDEYGSVRRAVAGHPSTPVDLLTVLAKDEDRDVRSAVAGRLK